MRADDPLLLALEVPHDVERVLLAHGRTELAAQLPFDSAEQVKLGVVRLVDAVAGRFGNVFLVEGRDQLRRHQHDGFGFHGLDAVVTEPGPDNRQIAQTGDAHRRVGGERLEQPGDRQGLSLAQLDHSPGASLEDLGGDSAVDGRSSRRA